MLLACVGVHEHWITRVKANRVGVGFYKKLIHFYPKSNIYFGSIDYGKKVLFYWSQTSTNWLIVSLAFADFLVGLIVMPWGIYSLVSVGFYFTHQCLVRQLWYTNVPFFFTGQLSMSNAVTLLMEIN